MQPHLSSQILSSQEELLIVSWHSSVECITVFPHFCRIDNYCSVHVTEHRLSRVMAVIIKYCVSHRTHHAVGFLQVSYHVPPETAIPSPDASRSQLRALAKFWQPNEAEIASQVICSVHIPRKKYTGLEGQMQSQQPRLWGAHLCSATRLPPGFESQSSSSMSQEMKSYCTGHYTLTTVLIYTKLPLAKLPLYLCKGELLYTWDPNLSWGTTVPCSTSFQRCPSRAQGFSWCSLLKNTLL